MLGAEAGVVARGVADGVVSSLSDVHPTSRLPETAATSATQRALLCFTMHPIPAPEDHATLVLHP